LLTHLNLSDSGISKLTNLVSLDLSTRFTYTDDDPGDYPWSGSPNNLWEPNFQTLVANLSNLRELYLDFFVSISPSTAEDCFKALANSVPHLQVLSLEYRQPPRSYWSLSLEAALSGRDQPQLQ
jgi:hypothetical protein